MTTLRAILARGAVSGESARAPEHGRRGRVRAGPPAPTDRAARRGHRPPRRADRRAPRAGPRGPASDRRHRPRTLRRPRRPGPRRAAEAGADSATWARIAELRERARCGRARGGRLPKGAGGRRPRTAALSLARIQLAAGRRHRGRRRDRPDAPANDARRRVDDGRRPGRARLDEALGRLPELADTFSPSDSDGARRPPPGAGRSSRCSSGCSRALPRFRGRRRSAPASVDAWLRPLLELVTEADRRAGSSGDRAARHAGKHRRDAGAGPHRGARRCAGRATAGRTANIHAAPPPGEARVAALVALGRLADPRGLAPLAAAATAASAEPLTTRAAAVWGLGRIADGRVPASVMANVAAILLAARSRIRRRTSWPLACLGLGRSADARTVGRPGEAGRRCGAAGRRAARGHAGAGPRGRPTGCGDCS